MVNFVGVVSIYTWFRDSLLNGYEEMELFKESTRGSVRLIRHKNTRRKFILREFTGDAEVYRRLLDISCRNLPTVYEVASRNNRHLVLEEYIQGDTLDYLLRGSLFTAEETRRIVAQLCQALWVLHSMDAVHRDVKLENVIMRGDNAVLIDFDAARLHKPEYDSDTQILGTEGYAAPEQYGLSQTDIRTDIYSIGVMINLMLTGQHPSRQLAPGKFGRVVLRCTAVNPQKRYKNVLRLMEAI
jgi:serine/threonine protein kinase